jgi:hypothetical protein
MQLLMGGYLRAALDRINLCADLKTAIGQLGEKLLLDYRSDSFRWSGSLFASF